MPLKYHFLIYSSTLPVSNQVTFLIGKVQLETGSEGSSQEIANYFDELVEKKKSTQFVFIWNPPDKFKSTFISIKADSKSKKKPKTFNLKLIARLLDDGKAVWTRNLDITNAWVKDASQTSSHTGGELVVINYESAKPSDAVHH